MGSLDVMARLPIGPDQATGRNATTLPVVVNGSPSFNRPTLRIARGV